MPIPWLTALKVIPWGDVIEHAPAVLKGARDLLEKQRQRRGEAPAAEAGTATDVVEMPDPTPPEVRALRRQLDAAHADIAQLQQTQEQIAQTLSELAEQNTRLVAAVETLRKRSRLFGVALLLLAAALAGVVFSVA